MNFTAVLLAGGQSRRMGRDKAGVLYEGEPLWRRQISTLQNVRPAPTEVLISGRPHGPYAESGYPIVQDEHAGCGPLGGVAAGLGAAQCEMVLILAIDLPLITSEFLSVLMARAVAADRGVVFSDGRAFQPLAGIYTRGCLEIARDCLAGEDHSMQRFIRRAIARDLIRELPLEESEVPLFRNVNTPSDLPS